MAVWRHPVAVLVPLAFVASAVFAVVIGASDAALFLRAGTGMVGPGFWDVFADPVLQIGPLYLLLVGVLARAAEAVGLPVLATVAGTQSALVAWLGIWAAGRLAVVGGHRALPAQWAVGGSLVLGALLIDGTANGHPEEIAIGLLLAVAAGRALRGRGASAGALVGLAVGVKLWGVLGGGVLLHGRRARSILVRGLVAGAVVVACYLPFFVWGDVRTFEFSWGSAVDASLVGRVSDALGLGDWGLRAVQGAAAGLAGALVALRRHGSPVAAVVAVVAVRLLLDPLRLTYYTGPLVAVLLVWAWTAATRPALLPRVALLALAPLAVVAPYALPGEVHTAFASVFFVTVPLAVVWQERRRRPEAVGAASGVSTPA